MIKKAMIGLLIASFVGFYAGNTVFSNCSTCYENGAWRDYCISNNCDHTRFYLDGLACCDGIFGNPNSCDSSLGTGTYERWSTTGTCTGGTFTKSCPGTAGDIWGKCVNNGPWSYTSYDDCVFDTLIGNFTHSTYFCD